MSLCLLDTDAVIDILNGISSTSSFVETLHGRGLTLCTCDVVIAEVFSGLRVQDHRAANPLLGSITFLPRSADAARQAGVWRYKYARTGRALGIADAFIAATALEHQATLVTGNVQHYPMPQLALLALPRNH